jgi:hypothetical protein
MKGSSLSANKEEFHHILQHESHHSYPITPHTPQLWFDGKISVPYNHNFGVLQDSLLSLFLFTTHIILFLRELLSLEHKNNITYTNNMVFTSCRQDEVDSIEKL